jgi:murein DD-endopeptidase MepM/ murein hydrolase activator NlpD
MDWTGYRVTSEYGERTSPISGKDEFHTGIDLAKEHQGEIYAFTDGKVVFSAFAQPQTGLGGYGFTVCVVDSKNHLHLYGHLDSCSVEEGAMVTKGQVVGKQGNTGQSAGSHLHYEIRAKTTPSFGWRTNVDPGEYLDKFYGEKKKASKTTAVAEPWKVDGLKYLQESYKLSDKWQPLDPVDMGTLGTILKRMSAK